jgi:hypothetical protein
MPAQAGIHDFHEASKKELLFLKKKKQKNFINFRAQPRCGHRHKTLKPTHRVPNPHHLLTPRA